MRKQRRTPHQPTWANGQLWQAIRKGIIVKPTKCEQCGCTPLPRLLQAHHPDHFKPLDVEWLCVRCHNLRPKGRKVFSLEQACIMVERSQQEVESVADEFELGKTLTDGTREFTYSEVLSIHAATFVYPVLSRLPRAARLG